jgi:hypothetical protein
VTYVFIYGMINLAFTKITGTSVYPVITWDNPYADLLAPVMIPFFMLLWLAIFYLSRCKFNKLEIKADFHNQEMLAGEDNIGAMNKSTSVAESALIDNMIEN